MPLRGVSYAGGACGHVLPNVRRPEGQVRQRGVGRQPRRLLQGGLGQAGRLRQGGEGEEGEGGEGEVGTVIQASPWQEATDLLESTFIILIHAIVYAFKSYAIGHLWNIYSH